MKTLILVAHPDIKHSGTQQFLRHQLPISDEITWQELPAIGEILDIVKHQELIRRHDRIIFQFPLHWYSFPVNLRHWQDEVLTREFAYGNNANIGNKEFGVVVSLGEPVEEYQAGGREQFTLSEILKPLQAMAHKVGWDYRKPLVISQFAYLNDHQRLNLSIKYQQYLTLTADTFNNRQQWFIQQLARRIEKADDLQQQTHLDLIRTQIQDNFDELNELRWTVDLIRDEEE